MWLKNPRYTRYDFHDESKRVLTKKIITGKRKTAIARLRVKPGKGSIMVNGKKVKDYFMRDTLVGHALEPLKAVDSEKKYTLLSRISGGGLSSQAGALRLAIARAIDEIEPQHHLFLKKTKMLTRDDRKVERKLFGHKKARKSFQFSKR